jgi:serine/threonine protein kinase
LPSPPRSSNEITADSDQTEIGSRRSGTFAGQSSDEALLSQTSEGDPTILQAVRGQLTKKAQLGTRYEPRSVLGEGGMGEVRLVWDCAVEREVAMKVLLPSRMARPRALERFLREAHVQGLLDHPGVVPVHDIGTLPTGEPYFTMKRVRGLTMREVLEGWRRNDARITSRFARRRMLGAFAQACLAIDYAHARGVVHRDLKPENVMLGDFGEVYVLDWGVARFVGAGGPTIPAMLAPITVGDNQQVLGTPGYMSPEQLAQADSVDFAADVYSLGALLFEILTCLPLHDSRTVRDRMITTREGADARCSVRAPDAQVPAALEALCVHATQQDPARRPKARELHESLESFLDGDREAERRRLVSELHLRAAKDTWKRALEGGPGTSTLQRDAFRGLGRALSAGPHSPEVVSTMLDMLSQPIDHLPTEAVAAMRRDVERQQQVTSRAMRVGRLSWFLYMPLLFWLGIRDHRLLTILFVSIVTGAVASWSVDRQPAPKPWMRTTVAIIQLLTMMPLVTLFSPLVLVPALIAASVPASMLGLGRRARLLVAVVACVAAALPLVLESVGVVAPSLVFEDRVITILPRLTHFPEVGARIVLLMLMVVPVLSAAIIMSRVRAELDATRRRVHLHLWRLRQLMPSEKDRTER